VLSIFTKVLRDFMNIKLDDLKGPEIAALLEEHLLSMKSVSPPESKHALDLEGLRRPEIAFWTVWEGNQLAGCGALQELNAQHAEIKSMRTSSAFLRKGVATRLLSHIVDEAKRRNYQRLSLETGAMEYFEPARRLYANFGFAKCEPFANYVDDPHSVLMTREV
jgi:putative acetyltransferase